jgi:hypothetical protein
VPIWNRCSSGPAYSASGGSAVVPLTVAPFPLADDACAWRQEPHALVADCLVMC